MGDFVHLSYNEVIPADVLFIRSAESDGICYVETSNLDGESNLKLRRAVQSKEQHSEVILRVYPSHLRDGMGQHEALP